MNGQAISLTDVTFRWPSGQRDTLDIESLQIASGERVFVHGPSGSGKSTLLSLVGGVNVPDQGSVCVLGQNLAELGNSARDQFRADHLGIVFQLFNLLPYLDVLDNVTLPCRFSTARARRAGSSSTANRDTAASLLARLGLTDESLLRSPVTELSVGQQQRVAVARALIGAPELVIADEPTSALDADSRDRFVALLMAECDRNNTTLLFVSHDLELGQRFDRTVSLNAINRAAADSS